MPLDELLGTDRGIEQLGRYQFRRAQNLWRYTSPYRQAPRPSPLYSIASVRTSATVSPAQARGAKTMGGWPAGDEDSAGVTSRTHGQSPLARSVLKSPGLSMKWIARGVKDEARGPRT